MRKVIFIILTAVLLFVQSADYVSADSDMGQVSAQLKKNVPEAIDNRVFVLRRFFVKYNSPLAPFAADFIESADKYNLDWRLVPAITGVESTYGKRIPFNSYNAYGWANGAYYFESWEDSIEIVSRTLRQKYYDNGAKNIRQIARRYAPPSTTWAGKVRFIMRKIDHLPVSFALEG